MGISDRLWIGSGVPFAKTRLLLLHDGLLFIKPQYQNTNSPFSSQYVSYRSIGEKLLKYQENKTPQHEIQECHVLILYCTSGRTMQCR